jgi:hypothetical protein
MRTNKRAAVVAALLLLLAACSTTNLTPSHPGQVNAFDGIAYDTMTTAQAAILQAKTTLLACEKTATAAAPCTLDQFKPQLNDAIKAYDMALQTYKLYHSMAAPKAADTQALSDEINLLVSSVASVVKSLGVKL